IHKNSLFVAEVDGKVEEILKALNEEEDNHGKGPVADLVKDFYDHYPLSCFLLEKLNFLYFLS
ncbi:Hypothetical predicted protein, partial [Olea europaea subsp. europaea]